MKHILFGVLILISLSNAYIVEAENVAQISFGCAPWDGRTLELRVSAPDVIIKVSIWAKGYDDLIKGQRTLVINNRSLSPDVNDATGRATVTGTSIAYSSRNNIPENERNLIVHFDTLELKEGASVSGFIQEPNSNFKWPFKGIIHGTSPCG